jgi:DNA-directed RNA polymerase subunit RPC12/RpoP
MGSQEIDQYLASQVTWCKHCVTCQEEHEVFSENDYYEIYICKKCKIEIGENDLDSDYRCPECHCKRFIETHERCDCETRSCREHFSDADNGDLEREYQICQKRYFECKDCGYLMPIGLNDSLESTEFHTPKTCEQCTNSNLKVMMP